MKIFFLTLTLCLPLASHAAQWGHDLTGQVFEGTITRGACPEGNAEIDLKTSQGKITLYCNDSLPFCEEICGRTSKQVVRYFKGKTVTISIARSEQWPPQGNWLHFIGQAEIE